MTGEQLRKFRNILEMSQKELGHKFGLNARTIQRYENETEVPPWVPLALETVYRRSPIFKRVQDSMKILQEYFDATPHR